MTALMVGLGSLALAFIAHAVVVGRWTGRLQYLAEQTAAQHSQLVEIVREHADRLARVETRLEERA